MALTERQKRAIIIKWAQERDLVICSKDALHRLVRIINDVALGVSARVDEKGEVHFNVSPDFNYTEMMGLKGIIESNPKYQQGKERKPCEKEEDKPKGRRSSPLRNHQDDAEAPSEDQS